MFQSISYTTKNGLSQEIRTTGICTVGRFPFYYDTAGSIRCTGIHTARGHACPVFPDDSGFHISDHGYGE